MNDYERIASVIRAVDERHARPPDLAPLAACAGVSQSGFHRLLFAWAAITPEDFLQRLTISHTKELLRQGKNALVSGSSAPARLGEPRISLESASPGESRSGAEGWTIVAGFADSPFGRCLAGESPRGLCHLSFVASQDGQAEWAALQQAWSGARLQRDDAAAARIAGRVFTRPGQARSLPELRAFVRGTPFQVMVWRALLQVPAGSLISYGHLASALGRANAARAVGTAVGQNPLAYLVPCHRVIRATGVLGEYRWGQIRKRAMVAWESGPRSATGTSG